MAGCKVIPFRKRPPQQDPLRAELERLWRKLTPVERARVVRYARFLLQEQRAAR